LEEAAETEVLIDKDEDDWASSDSNLHFRGPAASRQPALLSMSQPISMATSSERHLYQYAPLTSSTPTRLVKIQPGEFGDPIQCSIYHVDLDTQHDPFVALSYHWGDPNDITTIHCDGQQVSITKNLFFALIRMRQRKAWHTFWADALSINQYETKEAREEKGEQVQLMSRIFSQAKGVVVDLGHSDEDTDLAIKLMERIASLNLDQASYDYIFKSQIEGYDLPDLKNPSWTAWMKLVTRTWFNRVWMVQEFALAREVKMMIGPYVFDGAKIERAFNLTKRIQPPTTALRASIKDQRGLPLMIMIRGMHWNRDPQSLASLFAFFTSSQSTDNRDRIYAVLGLVNDDNRRLDDTTDAKGGFRVDYNEPTKDVATRFAKHLAFRNLNALWEVANGPHPEQPSWAPSLEMNSFRGLAEGLYPHLKLPALFHASRSTEANIRFSTVANVTPLMTAKGCEVDAITATTDVYGLDLVEPESAIGKIGTGIIKFEQDARRLLINEGFPIPQTGLWDPYWRTLISDCTSNAKRAPPEFVNNFKAFAAASDMIASEQDTRDVEDHPELMQQLIQLTPFMLAYGSAMFHRRVCITEKGRIGNVPSVAEPGDKIVVVCGADRPLIMRKKEGQPYDQYIGTSYLHGIMDGEALGLEDWKLEDISIV
jgi:Heterokaryon incompatibility protein (HET)